jgi:hypothetical protein
MSKTSSKVAILPQKRLDSEAAQGVLLRNNQKQNTVTFSAWSGGELKLKTE